jgi:hypothetical protein
MIWLVVSLAAGSMILNVILFLLLRASWRNARTLAGQLERVMVKSTARAKLIAYLEDARDEQL